ncbi:hypothetical protein APHAL10511_003923 [Amanita phalloides]|nr:hypothetical protein APHAL10511_003923 [Amanita phalloides]
MTLDITKFHRTCPILPDHKLWFVVRGSKGFFIDHACPFGCSSASSSAGMISNAAVDIWEAEGVRPISKYEDDLAVFRSPIAGGLQPNGVIIPFSFAYDKRSALELISPLNIPWHPEKGQDFSSTFKYTGFLWDIDNRTVSLPLEKRLKFLGRVREFIASFSSSRCAVRDVMKIHGSLCHIAYVYPEGCNRLASLSNFIASFANDYEKRFPPNAVMSDLHWWLVIEGRFRPISSLALIDPNIFVDASTSWGIGIWLDGHWEAW